MMTSLSDLDNADLMLARGQYSTLRREAQQRLDALAGEWRAISTQIQDALTYRHISECRPAGGLIGAVERMQDMAERACEIENICERLAELRPVAWQGKGEA